MTLKIDRSIPALNSKAPLTLLLLCCCIPVLLVATGAQGRDYQSKEERPIQNTAFTPAAGQWHIEAGLFGSEVASMGAQLGAGYAPTKFLDFGINLAHLGTGVLNVYGKWNIVDRNSWGIGFKVGFIWVHGDWAWAIPADDDLLNAIDIFIVPLTLLGTLEVHPKIHFDLIVTYQHAEIVGKLSNSKVLLDGNLGAKEISITPIMRFFLSDRVAWYNKWRQPLWMTSDHQISADVNISTNLKGGIRSIDQIRHRPMDHWTFTTGLSIELRKLLYLEANLSLGPRIGSIYSTTAQLGIDAQWRF